MRVWIDAQPLLGQRTGVGRYVEQLTKHLGELSGIECMYWFNQLVRQKQKTLGLEPNRIINSCYPYKVIRRLMKPNPLYEVPVDLVGKTDVFHGCNFIAYRTRKARTVLTVHDVAYLKFPEATDRRIYRHHKAWVPYSIAKADRIVAVSEQTKRDLMEVYKVPETKISVIPLAASEEMKRSGIEEVYRVKEKYRIDGDYLLYVGTIEQRKNLAFLIECFSLAKKKYRFSHKLVLVGSLGWKSEEVFDAIRKCRCEREVILTGYVDNQDLPAIYSGASLFLFPSIYEGFGIPVLEAMKCGVPVITSNFSSLPEVVGDAGILASLDSKEEWIDRIGTLLEDDEKRQAYSLLGMERAKKFSWERVARETIDVYREVLQ